MNRNGLGRFGVVAKTVLREATSDHDDVRICPECGTPVGNSLRGHEVAHPEIVDGADPEEIGDTLVVHGWKCTRHSEYEVVMPTPVGSHTAAEAVHPGWVGVRVRMVDGFVRTVRERYEECATEVYREALKEQTVSVYDILNVVACENGATYDHLEAKTGLARSTIRYHVARLAENGVVARRGNPVLVVFVSQALLERAREILRKVYPDDTPDDLKERAEERRDDRRKRQKEHDDGLDRDDEQGNHDDDGRGDDADDDLGFRYLDHLDAQMGDVAVLYDRDDLDEHDIRVRADALPPDLR